MDATTSTPTLRRTVWAAVAPRRADTRMLWWVGGALVLSGAVHGLVWLASGDPWAGAVSFRKPALFGWSFGLTVVSLAWVLGHLPARAWRWPLAVLIAVPATVEVALVALQRWRGVASHFNDATAFDAAVFAAMGIAVAVFATATVAVLGWGAVALRSRGTVGVAALAGLVLLLAAQGVGGVMIAAGLAEVAATGAVPEHVTVGSAGAGTLPHAVGVHGLQVLGALAVVLGAGTLSPARQRRLLWAGVAGYVGVFAATTVQVLRGRGPLDLDPATAALLVVATAVVGAVGVVAAAALRRPASAAPRTSIGTGATVGS